MNYFDGAQATGITQYGAKADIEAQNPSLCQGATSSPSFSAAWSMEASNNLAYYAQVGYTHFGGSSVYGYHYEVFTQWTSVTGMPVTAFWGTPASVANYETSYNFSISRIKMWAHSTYLTQTNYDPTALWTTPWIPEFFGETWHCQSDVPGTQSNPVKFSAIQKKTSDGTWSQINDLGLPTPDCSSRYHHVWVTSPNSFNIWTYPLS